MNGLLARCRFLFLCSVIVGCILFSYIHPKEMAVMQPVERKVIVLDAGHGGWDPGRVGSGENASEKDINLAVMKKLQQYLELGGATVYITRATDEALAEGKNTDLKERKRIAEENRGDILISIHQNAFPSSSARGAQVFYHGNSEEGKRMAQVMQARLCTHVDTENTRQAKANDDYYMLRKTELPTVLIECGFISNPQEEKLLNDEAYQEKLAWAIYMGVVDYFSQEEIV